MQGLITCHLQGPGDGVDIEGLLARDGLHLHHAVAETVLLVQVSGVHHRDPPPASPGLDGDGWVRSQDGSIVILVPDTDPQADRRGGLAIGQSLSGHDLQISGASIENVSVEFKTVGPFINSTK